MTPTLLARLTGATLAVATRYAPPLDSLLTQFEINTPARISAFLANVAHETAKLAKLEEDLYYTTPARLVYVYPSLFGPKGRYKAEDYVRNSAGLSRIRYAGFHGRGWLHLTWKENYEAAGKALGFDYVKNPALVSEPWHAIATGAWFWSKFKECNELADVGDMFEIRKRINGEKALGLVETKAIRLAALKVYREENLA